MARHDAGPARDAMPDVMADAMPDMMPDARDPTVRVRVPTDLSLGTYEIRFYSPGNQLIASVMADADGRASAGMPEGGTVLVMPDPATLDFDGLRALFGVKPGDDIKVFPPAGFGLPTGTSEMTITVPPGKWLRCTAPTRGAAVVARRQRR